MMTIQKAELDKIDFWVEILKFFSVFPQKTVLADDNLARCEFQTDFFVKNYNFGPNHLFLLRSEVNDWVLNLKEEIHNIILLKNINDNLVMFFLLQNMDIF